MRIVTCVAPVNIAVIKYWGKRDEDLILPINDSISASLSTDIMCAKTTVMLNPTLKEDKFWLNGKEQSLNDVRLQNCLKLIKERSNLQRPEKDWKIVICSENNFPTAAGLASSAAGYACLAYALGKLYDFDQQRCDLSIVARQGSGSACRSVYGGWVWWQAGILQNGSDSLSKPIAAADHWPEMRILILVVNDNKKKHSSTSAMRRGIQTSKFLHYRAEHIVPERITEIKQAILERNFQKFAEITMKDSNQFHAVCLDTYPPCNYMNNTSHAITDLVHCYNEFKQTVKVAYTFDAGPNACLYLLQDDVEEFLSVINHVFPKSEEIKNTDYFRGLPLRIKESDKNLINNLQVTVNNEGMLKYIIHTKVGNGPRVLLGENDHLLTENGVPKKISN